jgi:uncharacterized Zn-finger protein
MAAFTPLALYSKPNISYSSGLLGLLASINVCPNPEPTPQASEKPILLPALWFEAGIPAPQRYLTHFPGLIKKKRATPARSYKCNVSGCSKAFLDSSSLYKHLQTHGDPQHICPICTKPFYEKAKLRRHMLVHTVRSRQGERTYKCHVCEKLFALGFNLKTHMRTHTGERPFACAEPGCGKRFTQSSNLSSHMKTHGSCGQYANND